MDLPDGCTVRTLMDSLMEKHGEGLRKYLLDEKTAEFRRSIQFLVGNKSIRELDGLSTVLMEGDVFAIIPPVGGG
jgi:molybdopterin converting factor small subunit